MALSAQTPTERRAGLSDYLAIPEADRFHELLDGQIVQKALPSFRHGWAQRKLGACLDPYSGRPGGLGRPGGWWIVSEVELDLLPGTRIQPDLCGWRCENLPEPPEGVVAVRPDWVCEVLSPSTASRDLLVKRNLLERARVPHYWLLDPMQQTVTVLRLTDGHYVLSQQAERDQTLRGEPFELIEIPVATLYMGVERAG
jgi:Uma2 family endonuclease